MIKLTLVIFTLLIASNAHAWGKRGHETVGSMAAQLLAKEHPQGKFLTSHSYDMGFYSNVPDLVWKADDEVYKREFSQHYMDLDNYDKIMGERKVKKFNPDRQQFFKQFPNIANSEGRNFWRVQEMDAKLAEVTKKLKQKKLEPEVQRKLQAEWLLTAGVMGHYIGDLAQPLHVTSNYDGQESGQKGLHHWFEEDIVDDLYPGIMNEVFTRAQSRWPEFSKKNKNVSAFDLAVALGRNSFGSIQELLDLDKKAGRDSATKVSPMYREMVIERLTQGTLYLAQIWSAHLGWNYDGKKFYTFDVRPVYIEPKADKKP